MNRKLFFDMNSTNTFNQYDWFSKSIDMWGNKIAKEVEWPKWLTLPVHYQNSQFMSVTSTWHRDLNGYYAKLSCGHEINVPDLELLKNNLPSKIKIMLVSCKKCGGTGEIRFV